MLGEIRADSGIKGRVQHHAGAFPPLFAVVELWGRSVRNDNGGKMWIWKKDIDTINIVPKLNIFDRNDLIGATILFGLRLELRFD